MKEIPKEQLSAKLRRQINKAEQASAQGNNRYAVDIYLTIIKQEPFCLDARKQLRKAQYENDYLFKKFCAFIFSLWTLFQWPKWRRSNNRAERFLFSMEKELTRNPFNTEAHKIIADSAERLGLKETAIFTYETLCQLAPDSLGRLLKLADTYMKNEYFESAIATAKKIIERHPHCADAVDLLQRASLAKANG